MRKTRYALYADEIARLIAEGVLRPGERIPSVREAGRSRGISAATVFKAYDLLESRGLIAARPQSGYYVPGHADEAPRERARAGQPALPGPAMSAPGEDSKRVEVSELVFDILGALRGNHLAPPGSAFPSPLLFPLARLARSLSASVKTLDPWSTVADLPPGNAELRRQIAQRYLLDGVQASTEDIVVTNGALEALNLCLQAVTRPGDAVIVEAPAFYGALQALERLELRAIEVPTDPGAGVSQPALEQALERHKPKACWLMTNFQNPLGALMPEENKRALVALLARHAVPLIEDDVYGELYFGERRPAPAKAYDTQGLVLHCASFSKTLAPGYRVGWTLAGRYARKVERLKLMSTLSAAVPSQAALADFLAQGGYERHLRRLRVKLAAQRDAMLEAVAAHFPPGMRVTRPEGGYFLWVELPSSVDALALHRAALRGAARGRERGTRPHLLGHARLRALPAAELRASVERGDRAGGRHAGAAGARSARLIPGTAANEGAAGERGKRSAAHRRCRPTRAAACRAGSLPPSDAGTRSRSPRRCAGSRAGAIPS